MKICLVSKELAGFQGGGIGTYVAEAGRALKAQGHEVWLITRDPGEHRRDELKRHPHFHKVLIAGEGCPATGPEGRLFHGWPHYAYSDLVHRTIQGTGVHFDYIEFPDYEAEGLIPVREQNLLGSYRGTVLGVMIHSPTHECYASDKQMHRPTRAIREVCALEEYTIRRARVRTCPSQRFLEGVSERIGLPGNAARIIRYPMHLSKAPSEVARAKRSLSDVAFLYYGRIEPRKGVEELIEAFRSMPDLELTLVGGDVPYSPMATSFKEYVQKRAPANVKFLDAVSRAELLEMLGRFDVCVFPSLFENWPNACIEAMAAGRVVLGSRHGGMSEMIVDGESGFLVDGRDPEDIVRVVRRVLGPAVQRLDELGRAAATRIRELCAPVRYARAIEGLVDEARQRLEEPADVTPGRHRVSVIIPFYKEDPEVIEEAVRSACDQTHEDVEILVVNDGSPRPDAGTILGALAGRDPRVRVLEKANGGLASARNHGVAHATGEFYLFLDADNVLRPDYAVVGAEVLLRNPGLAAIAPYCRFFDGTTREGLGVANGLPFDRNLALIANRFGDAGAMFRASVFHEHGLRYDTLVDAYADWAMWMDLARLGLEVDVVPRVLYDYRVQQGSMIRVDGIPFHQALLGLLIQRHFPAVDQRERDLLATLAQAWGHGAVLGVLAEDPGPEELARLAGVRGSAPGEADSKDGRGVAPAAPPARARGEQSEEGLSPGAEGGGPAGGHVPLRYRVVDALAAKARRVPGLSALLRRMGGWIVGPGGGVDDGR